MCDCVRVWRELTDRDGEGKRRRRAQGMRCVRARVGRGTGLNMRELSAEGAVMQLGERQRGTRVKPAAESCADGGGWPG